MWFLQKDNGSIPAPDLDGGEPGAQAWWEAPRAVIEALVGMVDEVTSTSTDR